MSKPNKLQAIAALCLGTVAVWLVTTTSLVAYLSRTAPETAGYFLGDDPEALLDRADALLQALLREQQARAQQDVQPASPQSAQSEIPRSRIGAFANLMLSDEGDAAAGQAAAHTATDPSDVQRRFNEIRALTERALDKTPLNARAFRILGQISEATRDQRGAKLMLTASRRSLRESPAIIYLMIKSLQAGDTDKTLYYSDIFLRTRPQHAKLAMPLLARLAENKQGAAGLTKLMAAPPPWRSRFFAELPNYVSDMRTPLDLMFALKDTPAPPTARELRGYIDFLLRRKEFALAYYTWLQFLPTDQLTRTGSVFNASFEFDPSGQPFDWSIASGNGTTVNMAVPPQPKTGRALQLRFESGRVRLPDVAQIILLEPGRYRFASAVTGQLVGPRGLVWQMLCLGSNKLVGASDVAIGVKPSWETIRFDFTIPDQKCTAQRLRLRHDARSASERLVTGTLWYDDIRITRLPDAAGN